MPSKGCSETLQARASTKSHHQQPRYFCPLTKGVCVLTSSLWYLEAPKQQATAAWRLSLCRAAEVGCRPQKAPGGGGGAQGMPGGWFRGLGEKNIDTASCRTTVGQVTWGKKEVRLQAPVPPATFGSRLGSWRLRAAPRREGSTGRGRPQPRRGGRSSARQHKSP